MEQTTQTKQPLPQSARKHIRRQKAVLRKQHLSNEQREEKISGLYKKFEKPEVKATPTPKPQKKTGKNFKKETKPKNTDAKQKQAKPEDAKNDKQTKTKVSKKDPATTQTESKISSESK